jgi:hypothetical protein
MSSGALDVAAGVCLLLIVCAAAGCSDGNQHRPPSWTVEQAASIRSIRGHAVRVRYCHGRGPSERSDTGVRYRRFACLAGTRTAFQRYDTVGIFYVLLPLEDHEGPRSRHEFANVRFIGGPGIP